MTIEIFMVTKTFTVLYLNGHADDLVQERVHIN